MTEKEITALTVRSVWSKYHYNTDNIIVASTLVLHYIINGEQSSQTIISPKAFRRSNLYRV